jgi:hypothetical protein
VRLPARRVRRRWWHLLSWITTWREVRIFMSSKNNTEPQQTADSLRQEISLRAYQLWLESAVARLDHRKRIGCERRRKSVSKRPSQQRRARASRPRRSRRQLKGLGRAECLGKLDRLERPMGSLGRCWSRRIRQHRSRRASGRVRLGFWAGANPYSVPCSRGALRSFPSRRRCQAAAPR